jgi:imidazolonepropionase
MAVRSYGVSVSEAILGATREAAASLGLIEVTGALRPGLAADLVLWDLPHEEALVQPWGASRALTVVREGAELC